MFSMLGNLNFYNLHDRMYDILAPFTELSSIMATRIASCALAVFMGHAGNQEIQHLGKKAAA